eukprot:2661426-Rhodomonas_salina.1
MGPFKPRRGPSSWAPSSLSCPVPSAQVTGVTVSSIRCQPRIIIIIIIIIIIRVIIIIIIRVIIIIMQWSSQPQPRAKGELPSQELTQPASARYTPTASESKHVL